MLQRLYSIILIHVYYIFVILIPLIFVVFDWGYLMNVFAIFNVNYHYTKSVIIILFIILHPHAYNM